MIVTLDPAITVVDGGAPRPDLAERVESKFTTRARDLASVRAILRRSCTPIHYAGPVSTVYSLYFDTPELAACQANLDGVGHRRKTRLRWYEDVAAQRFFFETKWRRDRVVGKERRELTTDRALPEWGLRSLRQQLLAALPLEQQGYLAEDSEPVALIRYRREHYRLDGTPIRVTIDFDLQFFSQLGRRRLSTRFAERAPGTIIIETKAPLGESRRAARILDPLPTRPARFSKYVTACQQLGWVRGT